MRIPLIKVGEKRRVRQVLKVRSIIGHDVHGPWEEACRVTVVVEPLVLTGVVAQVGSRTVVGDCPSVDPRQSRGVVGAGGDGGIAHIMVRG